MKVIEGGGERTGQVVSIERFRRKRPDGHKWCKHLAVKVDPDDRALECTACGADVDPIDYIVTLSRTWDDVKRAAASGEVEVRRIHDRTKQAEAELARLQSRAAHARKKLGEVDEAKAYRAGLERGARLAEIEGARKVAERIRYESNTAPWRPEPTPNPRQGEP